jgi:hypothetical protein
MVEGMKHSMLAISLLVVAGCAEPVPERVWLRPGAPADEANRVLAACLSEAEGAFPEQRRVTATPRVTVGVGVGSGGLRGGLGTGVIFDRQDRNESARGARLDACMGRSGYAPAALPRCDGGPVRPLQSQPFDPRGLCVADGRIAAPA